MKGGETTQKRMKFVSLFAGIGGFDLALERLGHECVFANDFDAACKPIYDRHFTTKLNTRDITTVSEREIPEHDLLVGGFPCQAFSVAGHRRGFADTRGTLFFDVSRIAQAKRPAYLLLENVRGLLTHDDGRTLEIILRALDELGYGVQWQVLNSKYWTSQHRERIFIVGHRRDVRRPQVFPLGSHEGVYRTQDTPQGPCLRSALRAQGDRAIITDGREMRYLTPVECERLQGFPDGWTDGVSNAARYKALGNAVTVDVVQAVAARL